VPPCSSILENTTVSTSSTGHHSTIKH